MGNSCGCKKADKNVDQTESHIQYTEDRDRCPTMLDMSRSSMISMSRGQFNDCYQLGAFLGNDAISEMRVCHSMLPGDNKRRSLVKVVPKGKLNRLERQFFQVELSILKQLRHPGFAEIIDVFEDERNYFIVQEYFDNSLPLLEYLENKKNGLSEFETAEIIRQVLQAVSFCHTQGIVLRNLNPDSIVLVQGQRPGSLVVKLCDILTSVEFHKNREFMQNNVTLKDLDMQYLAPEILNSHQQIVDQRCDVWSIGVLMIMLLTGELPFTGNTEDDLLDHMHDNQKVILDLADTKLSDQASDLLQSLLRSNFRKRDQASNALEHDWFQVCQEQSNDFEIVDEQKQEMFSKHNNLAILKKTILSILVQKMKIEKETSRLHKLTKFQERQHLKCYELMSLMIDSYGVNYSVQECKQVFDLFQVKPNDSISLSDFIETWISKHEILQENSIKTLFKKLDQDGKGKIETDLIKGQMGDLKGQMDEKWVEFITITYKTADTLDMTQFESTFLSGFKLFEHRLVVKCESPTITKKKLVARPSAQKYSNLAMQNHVQRHSSSVSDFVKPNQEQNLEILIQQTKTAEETKPTDSDGNMATNVSTKQSQMSSDNHPKSQNAVPKHKKTMSMRQADFQSQKCALIENDTVTPKSKNRVNLKIESTLDKTPEAQVNSATLRPTNQVNLTQQQLLKNYVGTCEDVNGDSQTWSPEKEDQIQHAKTVQNNHEVHSSLNLATKIDALNKEMNSEYSLSGRSGANQQQETPREHEETIY